MAEWWESSIAADDPYSQVPSSLRGTVKQMFEGRMTPPAGNALRSPQVLNLIKHANDVAEKMGEKFDATTWTQLNNSVKDFSPGGKSAEQVRSARQTVHHIGSLVDAMDDLHNGQFPLVNYVGNTVNEKALGKKGMEAFHQNAHAVAEELSKVYKGGNLSDTEIRAWEAALGPSMSPEQQRSSLGKSLELLHGALSAIEKKRLEGMGPRRSAAAGPLFGDEEHQVLERVNRWRLGLPKDAPLANEAPVPVSSPEQALKLPKGKRILLPDGTIGVVP